MIILQKKTILNNNMEINEGRKMGELVKRLLKKSIEKFKNTIKITLIKVKNI